jgi:multisubunit Na+/H+ antiporter MnhE subunit
MSNSVAKTLMTFLYARFTFIIIISPLDVALIKITSDNSLSPGFLKIPHHPEQVINRPNSNNEA